MENINIEYTQMSFKSIRNSNNSSPYIYVRRRLLSVGGKSMLFYVNFYLFFEWPHSFRKVSTASPVHFYACNLL